MLSQVGVFLLGFVAGNSSIAVLSQADGPGTVILPYASGPNDVGDIATNRDIRDAPSPRPYSALIPSTLWRALTEL